MFAKTFALAVFVNVSCICGMIAWLPNLDVTGYIWMLYFTVGIPGLTLLAGEYVRQWHVQDKPEKPEVLSAQMPGWFRWFK